MNPYDIDMSEGNLQGPLISLDILYKGMPKTYGCDQCEKINGEDGKDWCCVKQSPSMYYVEFLKAFQMYEKWSHSKKSETIFRAVKNYLDNNLEKGCIFYNNGCQVYEHRPLSCRTYGVIPEEQWKKRWDALKERQGDKFCSQPQCSLVTSEKEILPKMEEKWFSHSKNCESRIGVSGETIDLHDFDGGSYRTFHDHLLLELFGEDFLELLTKIRMTNPSLEEIELTLQELRNLIDEKAISN